MHKGHNWISENELKKRFICSRCGVNKNERQEEIYKIPLLVRREVGYTNEKTYY